MDKRLRQSKGGLTDPYEAPPESDAAPSVPPSEAAVTAHAPTEAIERGSQPSEVLGARRSDHGQEPSGERASMSIFGLAASGRRSIPMVPDADVAPLGVPPVPRADRTSRRRTRSRIALAFGSLILFAGALVAVAWLIDRRPIPLFPSGDVGTLPKKTVAVIRLRADQPRRWNGLQANTTHEEALWSQLASDLCGGVDVFALFLEARTEPGRRAIATALDHRKETSAALSCGRQLSGVVGRAAYSVVIAGDPPAGPAVEGKGIGPVPERPPLSFVRLHQVGAPSLPSPPRSLIEWRERAGLESTRCKPESKRLDADCTQLSWTVARLEGSEFWITGPMRDVERFGRGFSRRGRNVVEYEDAYRTLALEIEDADEAQLGGWEAHDTGYLLRMLGVPSTLATASDTVDGSLPRALYEQRAAWAIAKRTVDGIEQIEFFVLTDGESDAKELVQEVKTWLRALREAVDPAEEGIAKPEDIDVDLPKVERTFKEAYAGMIRRSVRKSYIEREGGLVVVTFPREPTEDEQSAFAAMNDELVERSKSAAEAVRSLLAGAKPDEDLLRELGGRELVDAVSEPDASGAVRVEKPR